MTDMKVRAKYIVTSDNCGQGKMGKSPLLPPVLPVEVLAHPVHLQLTQNVSNNITQVPPPLLERETICKTRKCNTQHSCSYCLD